MRKSRFALVIAAVLAFSIANADADRSTISSPWLHDDLPDDALLYGRIPHPIGVLSAPKGSALDSALASEANRTAVAQIRKGISDNILPHIPAFGDPTMRLLEKHLQSPLEFAVLPSPAPSVLIAATLDVNSRAGFESMMAEMAQGLPGIHLTAPLDDRGIGLLAGLPVPAAVRFDHELGQLLINVGPAVSPETFDIVVNALGPNDDHVMRAMEARVDTSGQGMFFWVNSDRALAMATLMMDPAQYEQITDLGLDKVSAAAIGLGVANGKGRLSIVADLRPEYDRGFVPVVETDLSATSVGAPDGLFLMAIPSAEEFLRIEARVLDLLEADEIAEWDEGKAAFQEELGFSITDIFNAVGPELLLIFDEAGDYGAFRIRDRKLWDRILKGFSDVMESAPQKKRVKGRTYFHWAVDSSFSDFEESSESESHWATDLLARTKEHNYWTHEGDWVYFASFPQVLIDRYELKPNTDIGEWLATRQRINADAAVLSMSGKSYKLPERLYGIYIEILQMLADMAQVEVDIWSLPTARQLGLPRDGTLGFTLSLGDPTLMAEFTFENNPAEFFGGAGGVFMVGIVAAIAIPAYDDYTTRAKIAEGLALASGTKAAVSEHYLETGEFPGQGAAADLSNYGQVSDNVQSIVVEPGTGRITIEYVPTSVPEEGQLFLRPSVGDDGSVHWDCKASLPDKWLPKACRGGATVVRVGYFCLVHVGELQK